MASSGGLFINNNVSFIGDFSLNLGVQTAFFAEVMVAIIAIETTIDRGWSHLWLEMDSTLLLQAFKTSSLVLGLYIIDGLIVFT